ncbi:MAG: DNA polymerase domain-containing protein [Rhodospirillales bacterium]|nr:DNA polymerase domain-containing protein [Acetobacter sp.]
MAKANEAVEVLEVAGHSVRITHPEKLYFSREVQLSKLDIVRYFLSVAPGALRGIRDRPIVLKRFVNGAEAEPFYQKRAPGDMPAWMRSVTLSFPSGRTAEEVVVDDEAGLAWVVNLGCMELHPHPVVSSDLDHPNELRVDLDPGPGIGWEDVRRVALEARDVLEQHGLVGFVKTSGSRGIHVNAPIHPGWSFTEVRRAALALAREVERRVPALASSKWWKEERHGVFLDYNQNAKDRTTASAYSVRPLPDARVSAPLRWEEVSTCLPGDFTVFTMPARFAALGDPHADMPNTAASLESLLELAARDEASGLQDAPWPPHFAKVEGEGRRVAPSRARKTPESDSGKSFSHQLGEGFGAQRFRKRSAQLRTEKTAPAPQNEEDKPVASEKKPARRGRQSAMPLLVVAQSPDQGAVMAGLDRWRARYPQAAACLAVDDVLVDRMRGTAYVWYRVRVNLRHVPEALRPAQDTPDPDDDPTRHWRNG